MNNDNFYPYGNPGRGQTVPPYANPGFNYEMKAQQKKLIATSLIMGAAFIMYMLFSELYARFISGIPEIYAIYRSNADIRNLIEILYSFICVGAPFLFVFLMLKLTGLHTKALPLGRPSSCAKAVLLVFAGLGLCFAGSLVSSTFVTVAQSSGVEFYSYKDALAGSTVPTTALGAVILIFHSALAPALIEEFAFRGVIMQALRKYGDWFAIIVSAVLFGFMHANFTQVPFAIIAGVALGFATLVSGSMWTGIIIHFLNNFVSVVYVFVVSAYGESGGWLFSVAATYGFIALGILAVIVYVLRSKGGAFRLYKNKFGYMKNKTACVFLAPTMFLGLAWLLLRMLTDIVGFSEAFLY